MHSKLWGYATLNPGHLLQTNVILQKKLYFQVLKYNKNFSNYEINFILNCMQTDRKLVFYFDQLSQTFFIIILDKPHSRFRSKDFLDKENIKKKGEKCRQIIIV